MESGLDFVAPLQAETKSGLAWSPMEFSVYILRSEKNGRYYIGLTENVEHRLIRHNSGLVSSTKSYRPWKIVYREAFSTKQEASSRELQLKRWKSRAALERLIENR